jgi:phosphoserine aminotransferase
MPIHNFNSGPSILPKSVYEEAARAVIEYNNTGLSILEIGHRTNWFIQIIEEARSLVKELMGIGGEYDVLFLHGGATTQFMQVPMNFLDQQARAAYTDHGIWGSKAINEAKVWGEVDVVQSSANSKYDHIDRLEFLSNKHSYLHITTNNTVEGTQVHHLPETNLPIIADMSSDIFSRPFPFSKCSFIYAGAQKNMGAAGVTMVAIRINDLPSISRSIPPIMDYRKHIEANSLLNTPPVFAVYVSLLTLRWIKEQGGLGVMEKRNHEKSELLYNTIDALPVFSTYVAPSSRSQMNAVFFIEDELLQQQFLDECKELGMIGVKGYRTVGGIRVSIYNALPLSSVQEFCSLMKDFARRKG